MTRNSDCWDLEDLRECTHEPETPIEESGMVVGWLCRCGRRVPPPKRQAPKPWDRAWKAWRWQATISTQQAFKAGYRAAVRELLEALPTCRCGKPATYYEPYGTPARCDEHPPDITEWNEGKPEGSEDRIELAELEVAWAEHIRACPKFSMGEVLGEVLAAKEREDER